MGRHEILGAVQGVRDQVVEQRGSDGVGTEWSPVPVDHRHQQLYGLPPGGRCALSPEMGPALGHPLWMTLEVPASLAVPGLRTAMRFMMHLPLWVDIHHYRTLQRISRFMADK